MRMRHVATFKNLHNLHASDWWNKELSVVSVVPREAGRSIKRIDTFSIKISVIGYYL